MRRTGECAFSPIRPFAVSLPRLLGPGFWLPAPLLFIFFTIFLAPKILGARISFVGTLNFPQMRSFKLAVKRYTAPSHLFVAALVFISFGSLGALDGYGFINAQEAVKTPLKK